MKLAGIVLLILGALSLIYGGFTYNRQRTIVDLGPIKATATEQKTVPLSPIVGGIAMAAGVGLLFVSRKRTV